MWRRIFTGLFLISVAILYIWLVRTRSPVRIDILNPEIYPVWVAILQLSVGTWLGIKYSGYVYENSVDLWSDADIERSNFLCEMAMMLPYILVFYISIGYLGHFKLWMMVFPFLVAVTFVGVSWFGVLNLRDALAAR
jgi:hypothetical protein